MSTTTLDKALHVIERSAHFQARLHAQLAAFASEPNWPFTKLPLLTKSSDIEFLQQLAKDMNLGLNFEDSRIHGGGRAVLSKGGAHKPCWMRAIYTARGHLLSYFLSPLLCRATATCLMSA